MRPEATRMFEVFGRDALYSDHTKEREPCEKKQRSDEEGESRGCLDL